MTQNIKGNKILLAEMAELPPPFGQTDKAADQTLTSSISSGIKVY